MGVHGFHYLLVSHLTDIILSLWYLWSFHCVLVSRTAVHIVRHLLNHFRLLPVLCRFSVFAHLITVLLLEALIVSCFIFLSVECSLDLFTWFEYIGGFFLVCKFLFKKNSELVLIVWRLIQLWASYNIFILGFLSGFFILKLDRVFVLGLKWWNLLFFGAWLQVYNACWILFLQLFWFLFGFVVLAADIWHLFQCVSILFQLLLSIFIFL